MSASGTGGSLAGRTRTGTGTADDGGVAPTPTTGGRTSGGTVAPLATELPSYVADPTRTDAAEAGRDVPAARVRFVREPSFDLGRGVTLVGLAVAVGLAVLAALVLADRRWRRGLPDPGR